MEVGLDAIIIFITMVYIIGSLISAMFFLNRYEKKNPEQAKPVIDMIKAAVPAGIMGLSMGSCIVIFLGLSWGEQQPYEDMFYMLVYNFDRLIFIIMMSYVSIRVFWSKQKKTYLIYLGGMLIAGGMAGFLMMLCISVIGDYNVVNRIWGI